MRLKTRPRLKVTDQRFLLKEFGIADHTFGLYTDSAEEETIFIITGIAEDRAWIILAHELTHFWQKRNCPNPQHLALLEGFAESHLNLGSFKRNWKETGDVNAS